MRYKRRQGVAEDIVDSSEQVIDGFVRDLEEHGVDVRLGKRAEDTLFRFLRGSRAFRKACATAFFLGVYLGKRDAGQYVLDDVKPENEQIAATAKRAGKAGGDAKSEDAAPRKKEIRDAYRKWAGESDNGETRAAFVRSFAASQRGRTGFSRASIERAIKELGADVLAKCKEMKLSGVTPKKRNQAVAKAMEGQDGISLETVRRALE